MQKPNLDRLWRVWIKIGLPCETQILFKNAVHLIKSQLSEVINLLETDKIIDWYYFLLHGREKDPNFYFDVIFSLKEGVKSEDFLSLLPSYCLNPEQLKRGFGESISGISKTQLKNDEIEEAWRVIGEQSEWVINTLASHKEGEITIQQYLQFMHYFMNMMGLGNHSTFQIPAPYAILRF